MKKPLQLFLTFFKIGAFTLGGGYAMLSMVEKALVDQKKWIPNDEFWDMIAVVQSLPGVFAVNTALYVGHRVAGTKGAFAAMLGAIIPSITIILLLATVFHEYRDQPVVERIFKGIRPCVVALILAPSLRMIKSAKVTWKTAIIPIAAVFLIWWCKISPAYVILAAIAGSLIYALIIQRRETARRETARPETARRETARRERLTALNASHFDKLNDREGSLSPRSLRPLEGSKGPKSRSQNEKEAES